MKVRMLKNVFDGKRNLKAGSEQEVDDKLGESLVKDGIAVDLRSSPVQAKAEPIKRS